MKRTQEINILGVATLTTTNGETKALITLRDGKERLVDIHVDSNSTTYIFLEGTRIYF